MSPSMRKFSIIAGVFGLVFAAWWYFQMPSPKLNGLDRPSLTLSATDGSGAGAGSAAGRRPAVKRERNQVKGKTSGAAKVKRNANRTPDERRDAARKRRQARLKRRADARKKQLDNGTGAAVGAASRKAPARANKLGRRPPRRPGGIGRATGAAQGGLVDDLGAEDMLADDIHLDELEALEAEYEEGLPPEGEDDIIIE
jgi:hypothetical protein